MTEATPQPTISTAQPEDFFQLLKPRVMSLVVFTGATGLVVARGGIDWISAAIAILCIAVGAGAAGALNMALEGETDALMRRTRGRPVAAGRVRKNDAMTFGVILSIFSVMLLGMTANWLAGGLLLLTILYYAVFYTLLLKRRTPQNIVIGGAAGAFPPLIGWVAATGEFAPLPLILFAIIFLWTPPHFWALSLFVRSDYAAAKVPMLPVTAGIEATRRQIFLYSLPMAAAAVAPWPLGLAGAFYGVVAAALSAAFVVLAAAVLANRAAEPAQMGPEKKLFGFSVLYLFALFAVLVADRFIAP